MFCRTTQVIIMCGDGTNKQITTSGGRKEGIEPDIEETEQAPSRTNEPRFAAFGDLLLRGSFAFMICSFGIFFCALAFLMIQKLLLEA